MTINVGIADDHALVRAGFRVLIDSASDLAVRGEAATGREAVELALSQQIDVMLMDIRMPEMDGIEATRQICSNPGLSSTRVLMLTTFETDEYVSATLRAGASGFLLKDAEPAELLDAIRIVAEGDSLLSPSVTRRLIEAFVATPQRALRTSMTQELEALTERELEVLTLVARGLNNFEIADELFMSVATAKTHVSRIMAKLDARDRTQLVIIGYNTGLVAPRGA